MDTVSEDTFDILPATKMEWYMEEHYGETNVAIPTQVTDSIEFFDRLAAFVDFGEPVEIYPVDKNYDRVGSVAPLRMKREGGAITGDGASCTLDKHCVVTGGFVRIPGSGERLLISLDRSEIGYPGMTVEFNNIELRLE